MSFGGRALTIADKARRTKIHAGNCMACAQRGIDLTASGYVQWHHLDGKTKPGCHQKTIGLCQWHHLGHPMGSDTYSDSRRHYGPSLAKGSKPFHVEFGSDDELLKIQNEILGL
jgi:Recombination enhancement, RecA-dependent nuclease